MKSRSPHLTVDQTADKTILCLKSIWRALDLAKIQKTLAALPTSSFKEHVVFDFQHLSSLDTAAGFILLKFMKSLEEQGSRIESQHESASVLSLFKFLEEFKPEADPVPVKVALIPAFLSNLGKTSLECLHSFKEALDFLGRTVLALGKTVFVPQQIRFVSLVDLIHRVGASALPIVGLISFLIGIVLVYQGADQLRRFGAEIFTINLLAVSALRELGILMTAIVVAGRSGSAYTAQLGFMKLNQEIDALIVLGFDPIKILVVPRVLALVIALPLLTFFSDIMALVGGGVTTYFLLGVGSQDFCHHLLLTIKPWTFWTGMIKAPIFAFFIAITACFEGFRVSGGAESVGQRTTQSVVESIFLVLTLDAMFSILFSMLRI